MDTPETRPSVLSIREFSRRSGIPVATVSRMVKRGQLPLVQTLIPFRGIPESQLTHYKRNTP